MEITGQHDGLMGALGVEIVEAKADRVVLTWEVAPMHLQPMGIVHGGVHCAIVETGCSVGAWLALLEREPDASKGVVGLENHTSFIRAVGVGSRLRAVATPITRGRTTQVWETVIYDAQEQIVATGRVRLMVVEQDLVAQRSSYTGRPSGG